MKKKAEDLKPGDVLTYWDKSIVLYSEWTGASPDVCVKRFSPDERKVLEIYLKYGQAVEVESPALTPAQQHAEELLRDVEVFLACDEKNEKPFRSFIERAEMLVAQIKPPSPPTMGEALAALAAFEAETMSNTEYGTAVMKAREVVKAARRAGVLP